MGYRRELTGRQFGYWLVESFSHKNERGEIYWNCKCQCGGRKSIRTNELCSGRSTSCGCYHREAVTTHGMTDTPTWASWHMMVQRCTNPKAKDYYLYGKRGIKVCERWANSFENFLADMGVRPEGKTLDRIRVNCNYEKDNCKWSTRSEQQRNRRDRKQFTYAGSTQTLAAWAEDLGISYSRLVSRIGAGWPIDKALSTPRINRGPKAKRRD